MPSEIMDIKMDRCQKPSISAELLSWHNCPCFKPDLEPEELKLQKENIETLTRN